MAFSYLRFCSWVLMLSLGRMGFWPLRTEAPRAGRGARPSASVAWFSGGGVGGKLLRLTGGSDCCLREERPGLTRLEAAKEMFSAGRSSLTSALN